MQAVASQEVREEAIADFVKGIVLPAVGCRPVSLWATWMEVHEATFCTEVPLAPAYF